MYSNVYVLNPTILAPSNYLILGFSIRAVITTLKLSASPVSLVINNCAFLLTEGGNTSHPDQKVADITIQAFLPITIVFL